MNSVLEIKFSGWTATPRMPFIISGNAICLPVPTYSLLLGMIGCCLGRLIDPKEVKFGFHYSFDAIATDLETRQRLEYDGKRIKKHSKGSDAYSREFHVNPVLTIWLDRLDWEEFFQNPIGTPALGRSQDILKIESVRKVNVKSESEITVSGTMLPYNPAMQVAGQLVQLAEAYLENDEIGSGRTPLRTKIFIAIPQDSLNKIQISNLYSTIEDDSQSFYLHTFE
jgi:CRISPR-associated protein Cas5t